MFFSISPIIPISPFSPILCTECFSISEISEIFEMFHFLSNFWFYWSWIVSNVLQAFARDTLKEHMRGLQEGERCTQSCLLLTARHVSQEFNGDDLREEDIRAMLEEADQVRSPCSLRCVRRGRHSHAGRSRPGDTSVNPCIRMSIEKKGLHRA